MKETNVMMMFMMKMSGSNVYEYNDYELIIMTTFNYTR